MSEVDRSAYNDIMQAFENKIGEMIMDEAERWASNSGLKKIEAYIVLENVLAIMKQEIKNEKKKS